MVDNHTRPVRVGEELNEKNLRKYLMIHHLIEDDRSPLIISQFKNGFSNLTYLLEIEEKEYVLRRPPFAAPKRGHNMEREYRVLDKLHPVFEKTPKVFSFSEDVEIIGVPFYIMNKVDGIILTEREVAKRNITPGEFKIIADTWLSTFVELHAVDYLAAGLESLGRPDGYVARQVKNWGLQYLAAVTDDVPNAKKVMNWLHDHQPENYQHSLIHNDYKYDNIVFENEDWKNVSAILDWEMCTIGDPLMDSGTSLAYWSTASDVQHGLSSTTTMEGNPNRSELVQEYAIKSGREVNYLIFYFAFGFFKIAVITQQIYYRFKHGHTSDPRFASLNKISALCINSAWQAIQKNSIDNL